MYELYGNKDNNLNKILDQNISISINEDEGLIKLSVIDENPEISAFIASKAIATCIFSSGDWSLKRNASWLPVCTKKLLFTPV